MGVKWTDQQQQVIDLRDRNLLVSAAAGSGKTAVLVERIIQKVLDPDHPVDIDHLLVVTFTKAAAAEMRERVAKVIEARMDKEKDNAYLHRQYTLVHHAQITTIDSFCLYVVKNYFQCIGLEPGFRVGDPGELSLILEDVLAAVMEQWYDTAESEFLAFADNYASAKNDTNLAQMVRRLYDYSTSYPWPEEWLEQITGIYEPQALTAETLADPDSWLQELMRYLHAVIGGERDRLRLAKKLCLEPDGPDMYLDNIERLLEQLDGVDEITDYDELGLAIAKLDFGRLAVRRGFDGDKAAQELVKSLRSDVKDELQKLYKKFFTLPLSAQLEDLAYTGRSVQVLSRLTQDFAHAYRKKKEELGLLDFSDIEHMALRILVDEKTKEPTAVAREFQALFEEVMIDEYQDSNYVQEAILKAVSGGGGRNNRFMVGDVKQSIYRFRLARPELFMKKYDTYSTEDAPSRKICLDKNFRSRSQVLDSVNDLFYRIMKRDVGGVEYDAAAALYPGADYPQAPEPDAYKTRILLADSGAQGLEENDIDNAKELEAVMIAEEICRVKEHQRISDGAGGFRPVAYSDIVILLRSPGSWGDELVEQLSARGIPSHRMSESGYFGTSEVQTVLSLCHVIDNPLQDIPLAAVLRSPFFDFSDEELAKLHLQGTHAFFYDHVEDYAVNGGEEELREKCVHFLETLKDYRTRSRCASVHELLDQILRESGYLNFVRALPAGEKRLANVEMLLQQAVSFERTSYKGLFSFIRYMEQLQKYEVDFGEADVTLEHANVVRIMSIHKSKGLEFPIVFVSGLGRKFNKRDSTDAMILDSTYGVGLTCVEGKKHRKRTTLLREMIASRIAGDNIGEELRVLYVALTRAKEQLILTGTLHDPENALLNYELQSEEAASYLDRREAGCYLDWIMPGAYRHPEHLSIETYTAGDFSLMEQLQEAERFTEKEQLLETLGSVDETLYAQIDERLQSSYPYEEEVSLRTKISVSELKHRNMILEPGDEEALAWYAKEEAPESYVPLFVRGEGTVTADAPHQGALRGTAMHRMMECLDYGALADTFSQEEVTRQLDTLCENGRLGTEAAALVNTNKIWHFMQTDLAERIMQAHKNGKLYREQPFVMGLPAYETDPAIHSDQPVLVQGIIDLYFEEADGLVLLDYKTDSVKEAKQLLDRYQTQMDLYARALAAATGKPVKQKLIYSFKLEEVIEA
ncbi:MAG: helicase-exonuclease AddAB subunit AddA [Eubacterium sp.]|nr:helicase-exonuclease AddAB subunit AddA [Eubacterium sp.]